MSFQGITQDELTRALLTTAETELNAVKLLRDHPPQPGNLFPTGLSREQLIEATKELMTYSRACATLAERVSKVPSQPLPSRPDDNQLAAYNL